MPRVNTIEWPVATLVGEANPYGGDPEFALYPSPDGCSGHRLCCLILGMRRSAYLRAFHRVNLCPERWSTPIARKTVESLEDGRKLVLCGSKVCGAFRVEYSPFNRLSDIVLVLPHPSGRNLMWNAPDSFQRARDAVLEFLPPLRGMLGLSE